MERIPRRFIRVRHHPRKYNNNNERIPNPYRVHVRMLNATEKKNELDAKILVVSQILHHEREMARKRIFDNEMKRRDTQTWHISMALLFIPTILGILAGEFVIGKFSVETNQDERQNITKWNEWLIDFQKKGFFLSKMLASFALSISDVVENIVKNFGYGIEVIILVTILFVGFILGVCFCFIYNLFEYYLRPRFIPLAFIPPR